MKISLFEDEIRASFVLFVVNYFGHIKIIVDYSLFISIFN